MRRRTVDSGKLRSLDRRAIHWQGVSKNYHKETLQNFSKAISSIPQSDCVAPVGMLLVDLHSIYRTGDLREYTDSDLARLSFRKQLCLLRLIAEVFPEVAKKLSGIGDLFVAENLNCTARESLLNGLSPISRYSDEL
jgi:hypothetical protein